MHKLRVVPQMAMVYKRSFRRDPRLRVVLGGAPLKMLEALGVVRFSGVSAESRTLDWERWLTTYIKSHSGYCQNVQLLGVLLDEVFVVFGELEHKVWDPELTRKLKELYAKCTFQTYLDGAKKRLVVKMNSGRLAQSAAQISASHRRAKSDVAIKKRQTKPDNAVRVDVKLKSKAVFEPCSLLQLVYHLYIKKFTGTLSLEGREGRVSVVFKGGAPGRRRGSDDVQAFLGCMQWSAGSYRLSAFDVPGAGFHAFGAPMLLIYQAYTRYVSQTRVRQKLKSYAGYKVRPTQRVPEMLRVMGHSCPLCGVFATITDDIAIDKLTKPAGVDDRVYFGALLFAIQVHMLVPVAASSAKYPSIVYDIDDSALLTPKSHVRG